MHVSRPLRPAALAAGAAALALLAGCGSSKPSSTITVGNESGAASTSSATTSSATQIGSSQTPTRGPLSKQPAVKPPSGPAPTKLVTKDLIVGTGPAAKAGDTVTVNYVGVLYKGGTEFDASWKRNQPFSFALGQGQVIPGWDQGVAGMKVGGRRMLVIPANLAYGAQGQPPTIPPNAALVFVVDLLGIQPA